MMFQTLLWLAIAAGQIGAAIPAAWETFGTAANVGPWRVYDYSDGFAYFPEWDSSNPGEEFIWLRHRGDQPLEFAADASVGSGALIGNYATANVKEVSCDIFIDQLADFSSVDCSVLTRGTDGVDRWFYSQPFRQQDFTGNGWWGVRFGMKSPWTYHDGTGFVSVIPDAAFLSSVREISITFFPRTGAMNDRKAAIDNFILEPEVIAATLTPTLTPGQFHMTFTPAPGLVANVEQLSGTTPHTWTPVPGQSAITGPAAHVFTTPTDSSFRIFRAILAPNYRPLPPSF